MPLPQHFTTATLTVNGQRYDLVNVAVTDQSFEQEFSDVRGYGPRVVARTRGTVTERVTFEAEVFEVVGGALPDTTQPIRGPVFDAVVRAVADALLTVNDSSRLESDDLTARIMGSLPDIPGMTDSSSLESDESLRERILEAGRGSRPGWATGADLDAIASTYGIERLKADAIPTAAQLGALQEALKKPAPKSRWERLLSDQDLLS